MSTPMEPKVKNVPTHCSLGPRPETSDDAANNAETVGKGLPSPTIRDTALARVPKGPFKILTIPQAWYDSLHADHGADDDIGKDK